MTLIWSIINVCLFLVGFVIGRLSKFVHRKPRFCEYASADGFKPVAEGTLMEIRKNRIQPGWERLPTMADYYDLSKIDSEGNIKE